MKKVGRNEPCPCGCGRKFKVCLAERRDRLADGTRERDTKLSERARKQIYGLPIIHAIMAAATQPSGPPPLSDSELLHLFPEEASS